MRATQLPKAPGLETAIVTFAFRPADLARTLSEVSAVAATNGLDVMCSGTHPFSRYEHQEVTEEQRYEDLVESLRRQADPAGTVWDAGDGRPARMSRRVGTMRVEMPTSFASWTICVSRWRCSSGSSLGRLRTILNFVGEPR